jgi:hypothetical protein
VAVHVNDNAEITTSLSEIHKTDGYIHCGKNLEFLNVKRGGIYGNHWVQQAKIFILEKQYIQDRDSD